jgi:hypothetical protein
MMGLQYPFVRKANARIYVFTADYEDYCLQRCVFFHPEDKGSRLYGVTSQKTAIFNTAHASANI